VRVGASGSGPLVRLAGSAGGTPEGASLIGPTDPTALVTAEIALKPRDPAALAVFARDVATPGNPRFRHYLSAGLLAETFGPTDQTLRATRTWLTSNGLTVGTTSADGLMIPVTGSAARIAAAFAVRLVQARLADGRVARLASGDPVVPSSLAPQLQGVIGLSTRSIARPHLATSGPTPSAPAADRTRSPLLVPAGPRPCAMAAAMAANTGGWTADTLASTYGLSPLYARGRTGAGQSVGIFELEQYTVSDVGVYQACYGTSVPVANTNVDGGPITPPVGEAVLDIEVVAGLAPGASIEVYTGPNNAVGPIDTYRRMVTDDTAKVLTTSWGQCEPVMGTADTQAESTLFTEATAQGQTVLAASGDSGSSDCLGQDRTNTALAVDDPASQPEVTGVGGTSLATVDPGAPGERVWNDPISGGAGGGGNSTVFPAPGWQQVASAQSGSTSYSCGTTPPLPQQCREVPDVSASADPGHGDVVYVSARGGWWLVGGTSIASPMWAALVADVNQGCAAPAGLLGPRLYSPASPSSFNDVTVGSNNVPPVSSTTFPATAGYDLATGWGSPRAGALLALLTGAASGCPTVTGLLPASGPGAGGTTVVVSGSGLGGGTPVVRFGGVMAAVVSSDPNGTTVSVLVPAHAAGAVPVTVTSVGPAGGTSPPVVASTFTYLAPVVTSVVPGRGPVGGGAAVTIRGTGFGGASAVLFGGVPATFRATSPGTITAIVPPGPPAGGIVDIIVTATLGTSSPVRSDRYAYAVPGYRLVASDGGIFAFGDAGYYGSTGGSILNRPIVGMATTSDGAGYWLVASDGGIFAFGDAGYYGSTGGSILNRPIVGMATTSDGHGYWLVASDGGIFAFGDAGYYGSTGSQTLNGPMVGMSVDLTGHGYWLVASDGGIFAFGDAGYYGSTGGSILNRPIVGMAST
jgi:hypothetical protein